VYSLYSKYSIFFSSHLVGDLSRSAAKPHYDFSRKDLTG
jgi:hypothetical protein